MNRNVTKNIGIDTMDLGVVMKQNMTQVSFWDKIDYEMLNNIGTQTPGIGKAKQVENVSVQADGQQMRKHILKNRLMSYHTIDMSFYFDIYDKNNVLRSRLLP